MLLTDEAVPLLLLHRGGPSTDRQEGAAAVREEREGAGCSMTASEKLDLLIGQATLLRIKFDAAVAGEEEWATVRSQYGQCRRTLRSIQNTLHGIARKLRKQSMKDESEIERKGGA